MLERLILIAPLVVAACVATRPVAPVPTPASVQDYLHRHPHATLRIADSTGRRRWIYDAALQGDTLHGVRNTSLPRDPVAVPFAQLREVSAQRFSTTRTLFLVGAMAALVGLVALMMPDPVY